MGLRDAVALVFVIAVITQIILTHSMPSSSRKAFKHYLDNLNQGKSNSILKSPLPARSTKATKSVSAKTSNGKITNDVLPKKSMYKAYNFPEIEYPFDTNPRDPFNLGTNLNSKPFERLEKDATTSQSKVINNLKKEMRMKRKLNRITDNEYQMKGEVPTLTSKYSSGSGPMWLKDQETFPQVEYPMTAMETWGPNYWNPSLFNKDRHPNNNLEFSTFDPKAYEKSTIFYKPKEQLKSKTKQYMEEIERLKEKMNKATSHSKSNTETKKLDAYKRSTCGKNTGDLIKPDSNTSNTLFATNEPFVKKDNKCWLNIKTSEDDEYNEHTNKHSNSNIVSSTTAGTESNTSKTKSDMISTIPVPIPYKSYERKNISSTYEFQTTKNETLNNSKDTEEVASSGKSEDRDKSNISLSSETEPLVQEGNLTILDDVKTYADNISPQSTKTSLKLKNASKDIINATDSANITSIPNETDSKAFSSSGPLNVKIPIPPEDALPKGEPTHTLKQLHVDKVPYTSVIVVPVGDSIREIQLPIVESSTGPPIIVFLQATHNNEKPTTATKDRYINPSDAQAKSHILYNNVPNIYSSDEPSQNAPLLSDTSNSQILPNYENLPINSMCHNSSQSSSSPTKETCQDDTLFNESFLEMLQPIIAFTDTSSNNFENMNDTLPFNYISTDTLPSDLNEVSHLPIDDFSSSQSHNKVFTNILLPSVTEVFPSTPDISSPVKEVFTSTWVTDDSDPLPLPEDKIKQSVPSPEDGINMQDVTAFNIYEDKHPMPVDIVLPMDIIIEMIKNGTLFPANSLLDTPVINVEEVLIGPVSDKVSDNLPIHLLDKHKTLPEQMDRLLRGYDDEVDLTKNMLMAPQALELRNNSPRSLVDLPLPVNKLKSDTQITESNINILPITLTEVAGNVYDKVPGSGMLLLMDKELTDSPTTGLIKKDMVQMAEGVSHEPATMEENFTKDSSFPNILENYNHMPLPRDDRKPDTSYINNVKSLEEDTFVDTQISYIKDEQNSAVTELKDVPISQNIALLDTLSAENSNLSKIYNEPLDFVKEDVDLTGIALNDDTKNSKLEKESTDTFDSVDDRPVLIAIDRESPKIAEVENDKIDKALPRDIDIPETSVTDNIEEYLHDKKPLDTPITDIKDKKTLSAIIGLLETSKAGKTDGFTLDEIPPDTKITETIKNDELIPLEQLEALIIDDVKDTEKDKVPVDRLLIDKLPTDAVFTEEERLVDKETKDLSPNLDNQVMRGDFDPVKKPPLSTDRDLTKAELRDIIKYLYMSL